MQESGRGQRRQHWPHDLLAIMSATLGRHLEVHMSDYPGHEMWLAELKNHLETERYAATTMARCMNSAGHFLADLAEQHVELDSACP